MSDYLTKLKTKKQATKVLPKLPKAQKGHTETLPKLPKVPFGSKGSTQVGCFSEKKIPPPDLSSIQPEHRSEYTTLWYQACELEDYTSGDAPYPDRAARMPELNRLVEKMRELENKTKAKQNPRSVKKIPGISEDYFQAPAVWTPSATYQGERRDTCPACGKKPWWRKNEPGSKWICGRCHPPATGLDVIFRDE